MNLPKGQAIGLLFFIPMEKIMAQESKTFKLETQTTYQLDYYLYLPPNYEDSQEKFPLMLFLHGSGERGDNLERVKLHGVPKILESQDLPFIVISPQCPIRSWWSSHLPALKALIDQLIETEKVDTQRIYCTGLSMGGYGTWHMALEYPNLFAAIAPVCGGWLWGFDFYERICEIAHLPVWAFHGEQDEEVPAQDSVQMIEMLNICGENAKLTLYPELGHNSWTVTYANPELYTWFLEQRKAE
jgi:predicted peptidase